MPNKSLLIGESAIKEYIGVSSRDLFLDMLKRGLPARKINRTWYAHAGNIDRFFEQYTRKRNKRIDID